MNNKSAVWLILTLCIFAALMTLLFSVIGCEENEKNDGDTEDAVDAVITPETDTENVNADESVYYPDSFITDEKTELTDIITDIGTQTDIPLTPETEISKEPELASIKIKGSYTPSDENVDALYSALLKFGRDLGFTAVDLNTGMTVSYNADKKFSPASIIKASVVLYACKQIDLGKASLDEKLTYTVDDIVHGNGVIGKKGVGSRFTLREVIYHTVNTSDNEGYYMLLRRFGRNGHDDMVRSLGSSSGLVKTSRWPKVTAADFAKVWEEIYCYRNESTTGKWLYELFLNVDKMHFFRDALSVETANKAGWNASNYNDTGIIYGDRTYVLVLLTDGSYYTASESDFNAIVSAINAMMSEYALTAEPMPETERFEDDLPEPLPYEPPTETLPPETEPTETEPIVTEPIVTEPVVTEPVTTEPVITEPVETDPIITESTETEPIVTEPVTPDTEPIDTLPQDTAPVTETSEDTAETEAPEPEEETEIPND